MSGAKPPTPPNEERGTTPLFTLPGRGTSVSLCTPPDRGSAPGPQVGWRVATKKPPVSAQPEVHRVGVRGGPGGRFAPLVGKGCRGNTDVSPPGSAEGAEPSLHQGALGDLSPNMGGC